MNKPKITVFTATYNRGYIIESLYRSLQRQSIFNFEWLVIDDGSTDNTEKLFHKWVKEFNNFKIIYKKVPNGGLNRAINLGVSLANGEYFCKVDSDDYLTDDCIFKLNNWIKEIHENNKILGVGGLRGTKDLKPLKSTYPYIDDTKGYVDATDLEREKYNLDHEMCEVYKLEILKKYPFQVWPSEKFAPEQITLFEMALDGYQIRWHKDIVCICEYREDGLTKGSWNLLRMNPMGYAMMYNHMLKYEKPFIYKLNAAAQYIALSIVGKNPRYILKSYKFFPTLLALPIGIILAIRRKKQLLKN
ncbi:glycosyltransferase involved in cell wall biosynthesis [Bacillus sp. SLBN-46]|uniref:glycosyltransferase family 2 protein n=1 Tax=Bacillus sp. SLBN-46 TaxID=3042283 RepID=UPI00285E5FB8|nr:glycosyltransferase family A protein [Bacillus sp. SLBN-46]MDR6121900.1 glycosyltransferase involved in cell wall biosynthesis [Bacillus sp. SLBN-46]